MNCHGTGLALVGRCEGVKQGGANLWGQRLAREVPRNCGKPLTQPAVECFCGTLVESQKAESGNEMPVHGYMYMASFSSGVAQPI
jgi:hypothetical protein